jgi:hypothetical protein
VITFNVVKEPHGWAIRMGERMTTPFRSKDLAVREANCLAQAIRRHGERTEVVIEGRDLCASPKGLSEAVSAGSASSERFDGAVVI